MFTEQPYWLDEAYSRPINLEDTGIIERNVSYSRQLAALIYFLFDRNKKFIDFAGGYGIFTRMMRDVGFDYFWTDPHCQNIFAKGFEGKEGETYELVTAFEVFEHFEDPVKEFEKLSRYSDNIICSTVLLPGNKPAAADWWYYGFEHGQHISFYTQSAFSRLAGKFNFNYYNSGSLHLLTRKQINPLLFKLLIKFSHIMFYYIKKKMPSLTVSDQNKMKRYIETSN